jgi:translocation and assembly module TamA
VGASYEIESYSQGSQPRRKVNYLLPSISIGGLVLPEVVDPTSGHKSWLQLAGSTSALGADTPFLRVNLGHKRLLHLGDRHLLIARGEVGAIITDDLLQIPASQRFFTGGDQTVRGYDFESLSTRDASGQLIGGKYLNVASLEYSYRLLDSWRIALFSDSGRAFSDKDEAWHSSVGVGVRWLSPVGQIRVDLAVPVDDDQDGVRLHIFMGPPL